MTSTTSSFPDGFRQGSTSAAAPFGRQQKTSARWYGDAVRANALTA